MPPQAQGAPSLPDVRMGPPAARAQNRAANPFMGQAPERGQGQGLENFPNLGEMGSGIGPVFDDVYNRPPGDNQNRMRQIFEGFRGGDGPGLGGFGGGAPMGGGAGFGQAQGYFPASRQMGGRSVGMGKRFGQQY
jgi:hypothetical protein